METSVLIRPIQRRHEIEACARMMAASEPWITLQCDYAAALRILAIPGKELHLVVSGAEILGFILLNLKGAFVGCIQSICVAPPWRGQGVGRKLVDFAEKRVSGSTPTCSSACHPSTMMRSGFIGGWVTRSWAN